MDIKEALRPYWSLGHYSFFGDFFHTDCRFYCRSGEGLEIIDQALLDQLEAADPGQIFEMRYDDGFSWMERILPELQKRLGHKVQLTEYFKPPKNEIRGRTILFVEVMTFGVEGPLMAKALQPQFLATEVHGVLDRSVTGLSNLAGMRVKTVFRQPTIIWPAAECPFCREGVPILVTDLALG